MELVIVSPVRILCSVSAEEASFPGTSGRFTVLPGHAPLISSLEEGDIVYSSGGQQFYVHARRGCVRVLNDRIEACIETPAPSSGQKRKETEEKE